MHVAAPAPTPAAAAAAAATASAPVAGVLTPDAHAGFLVKLAADSGAAQWAAYGYGTA